MHDRGVSAAAVRLVCSPAYSILSNIVWVLSLPSSHINLCTRQCSYKGSQLCTEQLLYLQIAQRRHDRDLRIPIRPNVSDLSKDLIRKCLQPIPQDRLPLAAILKHPWFSPELESMV